MRQIGTLADAEAARKLADHLLTLQIETRLDPQPEGTMVWVCDEDRVDRARQELDAFTRNPTDPRYDGADRAAQALRRQGARAEADYRRQQVDLGRRWAGTGSSRTPWTYTLIAASVAASFVAGTLFFDDRNLFDRDKPPAAFRVLLIAYQPWNELLQIRQGQIWRLVTPIFLHFGPIHLLFNMLMLRDLGAAIESRRGPWRFLGLVLLTAVLSNLAQYEWLIPDSEGGWVHNPLFGGMSGVLYGLFGYVWMKSRYQPELGLGIHPNTVVFLIGWFLVCFTGLLGHVANVAHAAGLAVGIVVGLAPVWLRPRRGA